MLTARWRPYRLDFNFEARTSRAVMHVKDTYFLCVEDDSRPGVCGIGEVPLFRGLSAEDTPDFESVLDKACLTMDWAQAPSSVRMGFETALADLGNGGRGIIFPGSQWLSGQSGIVINGLIWMGDRHTMFERIQQKLEQGFGCLKPKIGGIDFDDETDLLKYIRRRFPADVLELRADANGAFTPDNALSRLERLSQYGLHSIEQPIRAGQPEAMARICEFSPVPVALDEELIGITSDEVKAQMLDLIKPQYIILKPALCGGFAEADRWIDAATAAGAGWWATSALESNIGLNAIAQWAAAHRPELPQGLGTGALYTNNTRSQLKLCGQNLFFDPSAPRDNPMNYQR